MDAKKKILIVEDDPGQQMALTDAIAKAGFLVRKASSGDEGLQMAINTQPDLIISDKMMPNMNGLAMMNMIRQQPGWGKDVPVFFFTNMGTANEEENTLLDFIKPIGYISKSDSTLESIVQQVKSVFSEAETKDIA